MAALASASILLASAFLQIAYHPSACPVSKALTHPVVLILAGCLADSAVTYWFLLYSVGNRINARGSGCRATVGCFAVAACEAAGRDGRLHHRGWLLFGWIRANARLVISSDQQ